MKRNRHFSLTALLTLLLLQCHLAFGVASTMPSGIEVSFSGAEGVTIHGTLLLPPPSSERVAAIVLLQGSGPTDRDDNQLPQVRSDLLKQIAEALQAHAFATLRFDKRGMNANRAEAPRELAQRSRFFSWENFAADAAAADEFLRGRAEIDPSRIGYLGHSEGGMLALAAAKTLRSQGHAPSAIVIVNTLGRSGDVVISEQIAAALKRNKTPADVAAKMNADVARINSEIETTGVVPRDVPSALATVYPTYLGPFLRSLFTLDPCALAEDYAGPVLLISSGSDLQTSAERDGKPLDAALRRRPADDHEFVVVPNASHFLKAVKQPDDFGFAGPVIPQALERIVTWTTTKIGHP